MAAVILDDVLPAFTYGGGSWSTTRSSTRYGGSATLCPITSPTGEMKPPGTISLMFEGTSVAFFGITPPVFTDSQIVTVSIDGGTPYNSTYDDSNPQSYRQWYQSPILQDGQHNISLTHVEGTELDFAVVTVPKGRVASLVDQQVIVDDTDGAFTYKGAWKVNTTQFAAGTIPGGLPYGNSTHRTTTVGDTFTFQFSGTSVSVYGVWNWGNLDGNLSATYTIDGSSSYSQSYTASASPALQNGDLPNFLLFNSGTLSSGNHTLVANLTSCVKQAWMIDYVTYSPSASTTTSTTNATSTSSSHPATAAKKATPIGAIAGGVVGGVVLLLVIVGFSWFRSRKSKKQDQNTDSTIDTQQAVLTLDTPSTPTTSRFTGSSIISPFLNALAARSESRREAEINRKRQTSSTIPQDPSVHKPGYRPPGVTGESPTDTTAGEVGGVEIGGVPPPAYEG